MADHECMTNMANAVEVMNPRSSVGQIEREISGAKPVRGDFIKDVRADDTLDGSVNTIDDGDLVYGRLALVLVLGIVPQPLFDLASHAAQGFGTLL